MQLTLDGIVLRSAKSGEDRVLTILAAEQGVFTAFANKATAPRGKLASATELLCYSRFVVFSNRGRSVVDKADPNRMFFGLRADYGKLCLASYFAQLACELCPWGEPAPEALRLLLNTLHYLEGHSRDERQLKSLFELRLLTLSGFMPDLVACGGCGAYQAEHMWFYPSEGTLLCGDCREVRAQGGGLRLDPGVLAAMRHIVYAPVEKLFAFTLSTEGAGHLSGISEQYLMAQVDKDFPALEMYRQMQGT